MKLFEYTKKITDQALSIVSSLDYNSVDCLVSEINKTSSVFVSGSGRSLLMIKSFAMRLMHAGFNVYVVGEIVTPAIQNGDLLIIASGSGETSSQLQNALKASSVGATVAVITAMAESSIGQTSDVIIQIPVITEKCEGFNCSQISSFQPGGSSFEQALFVLLESIYLFISDDADTGHNIMARHANLE